MSGVDSIAADDDLEAEPVQNQFDDIYSEITNSVAKDGQTILTGQLKAANGSASAPAYSFGSDLNTGSYRVDADDVGFAVGGVKVAGFDADGFYDANSVTIVGTPTGAMMMYGATTAPTGWVRTNGRTIGNASSAATERANADTSSLFSFLWTNYADAVCAVSTGRGASAAADYAANKTIVLPDLRGRAFFGLDDMGGSAASRLGTVITTATTNGSSGGTETHVITEAQLPAHTHSAGTLATASDGAHTHTLTLRHTSADAGTSFSAFHTDAINGSTDKTSSSNGAHTHTMSGATGSIGSGTAHSNLPPAFLTTFIIKL